MSMQNGSPKFSGYIRRLVDEGFLSAQQMKDALSNAQKNKVSIVAYLSEKLNITPLIIAEMISQEFGEPIFDLDSFNPEMLPKELIDSNLVTKHKVIPLVQRGNILYVATSDPTNIEALDAIRFNCGLNIEPIIVEHHKLEKYLEIISKELNIKNGVIKGDIVIYKDELYIIEFALRLSGGNFSTIAIPESTGVDFLKVAIKLHLNLEIDEDELLIKKNKFISLRYKFLEDINTQIIKNISIPNKDDYIIAYKVYLKEGDKIASFKTTNHLQRISYVISKSNMRDQSIKYANDFLNKIKFS